MRAGYLGLKYCEGRVKDEIFLYLCKHVRLPFDQKFRNFRNMDKRYGNFLGKAPENTEIVKFLKANHSTKNSGNSGMKVKWNRDFQEKFFQNLGIPHEVALFFGIYTNSLFSTQPSPVLLPAITASWTSHARMTRIR